MVGWTFKKRSLQKKKVRIIGNLCLRKGLFLGNWGTFMSHFTKSSHVLTKIKNPFSLKAEIINPTFSKRNGNSANGSPPICDQPVANRR